MSAGLQDQTSKAAEEWVQKGLCYIPKTVHRSRCALEYIFKTRDRNELGIKRNGREEASVRDGRVRVASMDLLGALMLKLRGRRPYLILATCLDKCSLAERIMDRKTMRNTKADTRISRDTAYERSALQAMLSGRIMVTGIINEIILALPDEKSRSEFQMESECSLLCDSSHDRPIEFAKDVNFLTISTSSASLLDVGRRLLKKTSDNDNETSFCSLYKESVCMDEYLGELMQAAKERRKLESLRIELPQTQKKRGILSQKMRDSKSVDFSKTFSTSSKALPETKSKSVSIIPQGTEVGERSAPDYGEPLLEETKGEKSSRSSSESASQEPEDMDLWLTFLLDNGLLMSSDDVYFAEDDKRHDKMKTINDCKKGHPDFLLRAPYESLSSSTRDVYETIHRNRPGLFWDTITMDDPEKAFKKAKTIIRNIVNSQPLLKPMFETDFADDAAPGRAARARLQAVRAQIAPQQLFH